MGPDVAYFPFKQQSDFYYLTGCMQPNALLLLNGNDRTFSTSLFLSSCSMSDFDDYQRWFGPIITDPDRICQMFGIDRVKVIDELASIDIPSTSFLFYSSSASIDPTVTKTNVTSLIERFSSSASLIDDQLHLFLHALRSMKSLDEQNLLRRVCQWTCDAFVQTMKLHPKHIDNESFVKSYFQFQCERSGIMSMAFHPVVAAHGRSH
jgi:Xaa-Pro aminopeptidase